MTKTAWLKCSGDNRNISKREQKPPENPRSGIDSQINDSKVWQYVNVDTGNFEADRQSLTGDGSQGKLKRI